MQKKNLITYIILGFLFLEAKENKIIYECPWPEPEISILSVFPTNLLRISPQYYENKPNSKKIYIDVPFDWVVLDENNARYVNLKAFGKNELQKDWITDCNKPMRYTYKYLYLGIYGLLLSSSDGKPLALETSVDMIIDCDPITKKEIKCINAYDYQKNKKLYSRDILIESDVLEAPVIDDIPVSFESPFLKINNTLKSISCIYPEHTEKKSVFKKNKIIFNAKLPEKFFNASITMKSKSCIEFSI